MQHKTISPEDYIQQLPEDRKAPSEKLRAIIKKNIPTGFEEGMNYNMIGFYVPHSMYPNGYHCDTKLPFMDIASQKKLYSSL